MAQRRKILAFFFNPYSLNVWAYSVHLQHICHFDLIVALSNVPFGLWKLSSKCHKFFIRLIENYYQFFHRLRTDTRKVNHSFSVVIAAKKKICKEKIKNNPMWMNAPIRFIYYQFEANNSMTVGRNAPFAVAHCIVFVHICLAKSIFICFSVPFK